MDNKEFKSVFNKIACKHNFEKIFGGWFMESRECILMLELQKSNFCNLYYLNIRLYIQGCFGKQYVKSKELVKKNIGDIYTRPPVEYSDALDLSIKLSVEQRIEKLEILFEQFIVSFSEKALSLKGIKTLQKENVIFITPSVEKELELLVHL